MAFLLTDACARKRLCKQIYERFSSVEYYFTIRYLFPPIFSGFCMIICAHIFSCIFEFSLCVYSVVSHSQGNPWLKAPVFSSGNNMPRMMIQLNTVHQYNLGTTNMDFKMFGIQTNFGISTASMFHIQIMYLQ